MKNLFLMLLMIGLALPAFSQKGDAVFFKTLSSQRSVHPTVKKASADLSRNFTIRDSLFYFTNSFEKAVLQGKSAGTIKPALIKTARKKYPGNNYKAASSRLKMYAAEGKKGTVGKKGRSRRY